MKSKNVLLLIPHLAVGGTEMQTLHLAKALVQGGHRVTVMCFYRCLPQMVQAFEQAGCKVMCVTPEYNSYAAKISYHRGFKLIRFLYFTLRSALREGSYDVIHVQYMTPMATAILVLRFLLGYKNIVVTSHTNSDIYASLGLVHFIQKHCCRVFTCITHRAEEGFFGISHALDDFRNLTKWPSHAHCTIHNTLPQGVAFSAPRLSDEVRTIGVVSRLEPIKGMDLVVPAFEQVWAKHKGLRLLVVGDGSLRETMQRQARELHIEDSVTFAGRKEQDQLPSYYDQMDLLLMPSRSEGFGLTAIEGMARGCVVVAANTGGLPEVVKDGEVGFLHQRESVIDLAAKILQLVEHKDLLQQMQVNVAAYVKRYSFENYSSSVLKLYEML